MNSDNKRANRATSRSAAGVVPGSGPTMPPTQIALGELGVVPSSATSPALPALPSVRARALRLPPPAHHLCLVDFAYVLPDLDAVVRRWPGFALTPFQTDTIEVLVLTHGSALSLATSASPGGEFTPYQDADVVSKISFPFTDTLNAISQGSVVATISSSTESADRAWSLLVRVKGSTNVDGTAQPPATADAAFGNFSVRGAAWPFIDAMAPTPLGGWKNSTNP